MSCTSFGFNQAGKFSVWLYKILYSISQKKFYFISINLFINLFFRKEYNLESFSKNKKKFLNYFDGYWQDINLLKSQKKYIMNCIENQLGQFIKPKKINNGTTLVHVRRGDYINVNEALDIKFYENAISYCKENIKNFSYEVFTDDLDWVRKQEVFRDATNINGPKNNLVDLLKDIARMLEFQNFVVGNSTFSLIPALLSESETSSIIVADPWMKYSNSELKFDKTWIKVNNF